MAENELETMANQIGRYFQAYPEEKAVNDIVDHLNSFWEKRMKEKLITQSKVENNLSPLVLKAIEKL